MAEHLPLAGLRELLLDDLLVLGRLLGAVGAVGREIPSSVYFVAHR